MSASRSGSPGWSVHNENMVGNFQLNEYEHGLGLDESLPLSLSLSSCSDDPRRMLEQARRECGRAEQVTLLVSVLPVDQMGKVCAISPWIRTS